jgi:hypothetical protein
MVSPVDSQKKQPKKYRQRGVRKRGPAQRKLGKVGSNADKFHKVDTIKLIADIARGIPIQIALCSRRPIGSDIF